MRTRQRAEYLRRRIGELHRSGCTVAQIRSRLGVGEDAVRHAVMAIEGEPRDGLGLTARERAVLIACEDVRRTK